jgi:hypothetical protein
LQLLVEYHEKKGRPHWKLQDLEFLIFVVELVFEVELGGPELLLETC